MNSLEAGSYAFGPGDGQLLVKVFREGVAARMGHDLAFEVRDWSAKAFFDPSDLGSSSLEATASVASFSIVEAIGGAKALTRGDRADIKRNIEEKILDARRFPNVSLRTTAAAPNGTGMRVSADLTIGGATRPVDIVLTLTDGRARGVMTVVQSRWGIKPFSAFMGALKVRDAVDVILDVPLPSADWAAVDA
jgi:polyisoprenoid-binding protein YceI